jgi:uncharacterized protein
LTAVGARRSLVVLTKPAIPGRVKTRLIGVLSAQEAAALHQAFLNDLLIELGTGDFLPRLAWALEPGEFLPESVWPAEAQQGTTLGQRIFAALERATRSANVVAAIGSDHPELQRDQVERAFAAVEDGADVALGPSADGGYYLIAVAAKKLDWRIFSEIPWSSATVFETTLLRCRELGLRVEVLPEGHDVDVIADLRGLSERLRQRDGGCLATRAALRDVANKLKEA